MACCNVLSFCKHILERVASSRARAEVLDVVETDQLVGATGTGDGRQVTGGPALSTLPFLIWQYIIVNLLGVPHALAKSKYTMGSISNRQTDHEYKQRNQRQSYSYKLMSS